MHSQPETSRLTKLVELQTECNAMMLRLQGNARVDWNDIESLTAASVELGLYGIEILLFASMSHSNFEAVKTMPTGRAALTHAAEAHQDALDDLLKLSEIAVRLHDKSPGSRLDQSMPIVISFAEDMLSYWREIEAGCQTRHEARAKGGAGKSFAFAFRP